MTTQQFTPAELDAAIVRIFRESSFEGLSAISKAVIKSELLSSLLIDLESDRCQIAAIAVPFACAVGIQIGLRIAQERSRGLDTPAVVQ
ncbi:MAG: hypothetical protein ABSG29_09685 [Steroidobacteraceae bacterium]|jgi:ABC-type sulfate transport system permease subunit